MIQQFNPGDLEETTGLDPFVGIPSANQWLGHAVRRYDGQSTLASGGNRVQDGALKLLGAHIALGAPAIKLTRLGGKMANAKNLILSRLKAPSAVPKQDAPARNLQADPTSLLEGSYVEPITRADASLIAGPGSLYGGSGGNQVSDAQLDAIRTHNAVGPASRTSPAGAPESGGF